MQQGRELSAPAGDLLEQLATAARLVPVDQMVSPAAVLELMAKQLITIDLGVEEFTATEAGIALYGRIYAAQQRP